MITERQREILNVIIEEYIDSAEPVSSSILASKYDFGLCSATIRIEMRNLTQFGFLEKPYVSSGRIPTDKAYRVFVDAFLNKMKLGNGLDDLNHIFKNEITEFEVIKRLTNILASISSGYIILSLPQKNILWQAGFSDIIKEPEFSDKNFVLSFLSFLEEFLERQEEIRLEFETKVFIGVENSFEAGKDFSVICSENDRFRLSLIGPKRMNYYKNIQLINSLSKIIEEKI